MKKNIISKAKSTFFQTMLPNSVFIFIKGLAIAGRSKDCNCIFLKLDKQTYRIYSGCEFCRYNGYDKLYEKTIFHSYVDYDVIKL